jgi:hypothetical protein
MRQDGCRFMIRPELSCGDEVAVGEAGRQRIAPCQFQNLLPPNPEIRLGRDEQRRNLLSNQCGNGGIDVACVRDLLDVQRPPQRSRRRLRVSDVGDGVRIERMRQRANWRGPRHEWLLRLNASYASRLNSNRNGWRRPFDAGP